jgi:two-component system phosphate regulon sensor histidine kinase PhoR
MGKRRPAPRHRLVNLVFVPAILVALGVLTYFTLRTTLQLEQLRKQSVLEATLGLATEKADRLDQRIIEQDNVVFALSDPAQLDTLTERWLATARRETPTVRAILVVDDGRNVVGFASRALGPWSEEESFRRLLVQHVLDDAKLDNQPEGELRHLHRLYAGQSLLVSYWQRVHRGRKYVVVAWHDVSRIVRDVLPVLYGETAAGSTSASRANVVDEEGRIVFGPPLRSGEFTVGVRFPTTLYDWRLQVALSASEELSIRARNRRLLELGMVVLSALVLLTGLVVVAVAVVRERRISVLKSDFVANVSHELKTPLSLIRMFGELLQSGRVARDDKRKEYLDIIVAESERLSSLIENVLDFARVERGRDGYDFRRGDLGATVLRSCAVYKYRAEREGLDLRAHIQDDLPTMTLDERAIQLAVLNLIDNAVKYAPGSGTIEVSASAEDGHAFVRVRDFGPGIAPDDTLRIFERFVRVRSTRKDEGSDGPPPRGSGIGLSLVKHIAEAHGGRAWVESVVGQGSTFVIELPLVFHPPSERLSRSVRHATPLTEAPAKKPATESSTEAPGRRRPLSDDAAAPSAGPRTLGRPTGSEQ